MRAKKYRSLWLPLLLVFACAAPDADQELRTGDDEYEKRLPPMCGALTTCGLFCADLPSDPTNCGACDRTCVIPNATAGCQKGECVVKSCNEGYIDNDRKVANGCELLSNCQPGAACQTTCASAGSITCEGGLAQCQPPPERCNAADDNCDGRCDEGALPGCRIAVHRALGPGAHLYTTDLTAAMTAPYSIESASYFQIYGSEVPGTTAVYLCQKPNGKFFLTSSAMCEVLSIPGKQLGYWGTSGRCVGQPLYRLRHDMLGDHFYTVSEAEAKNAVDNYAYLLEGIAGYVWLAP